MAKTLFLTSTSYGVLIIVWLCNCISNTPFALIANNIFNHVRIARGAMALFLNLFMLVQLYLIYANLVSPITLAILGFFLPYSAIFNLVQTISILDQNSFVTVYMLFSSNVNYATISLISWIIW